MSAIKVKRSELNLDELAKKVYNERRVELTTVLNSLSTTINDNMMPSAKTLLMNIITSDDKKSKRPSKSNKKIRRPPNSNIIYTNQLNEFGLLKIVRDFCDSYQINKQNLVPISKKISKFLWNDLSDKCQEFFDTFALEVSDEHKKLYPTYKYAPKRKSRVGTYKHYEPKIQTSNYDNEISIPIHQQLINNIFAPLTPQSSETEEEIYSSGNNEFLFPPSPLQSNGDDSLYPPSPLHSNSTENGDDFSQSSQSLCPPSPLQSNGDDSLYPLSPLHSNSTENGDDFSQFPSSPLYSEPTVHSEYDDPQFRPSSYSSSLQSESIDDDFFLNSQSESINDEFLLNPNDTLPTFRVEPPASPLRSAISLYNYFPTHY